MPSESGPSDSSTCSPWTRDQLLHLELHRLQRRLQLRLYRQEQERERLRQYWLDPRQLGSKPLLVNPPLTRPGWMSTLGTSLRRLLRGTG
jgi:hypothetical protein